MSAPPEFVAFHIGIVVHDLDAVIDRYRRMLGLDLWHVRDRDDVKIAYGGRDNVGLAFELIQPKTDEGQMAKFLREHGEGVQHLGVWTSDLRGSLQAAVAEGGTLVAGPFRQDGNTVVEVEAPPAVQQRQLAYIDTGLATIRMEFIGRPADEGLKSWLQDDYEKIITPGPWSKVQG
jgi:catechol 2,3-dioxygenase-like lactoylglutathione lyase family enzyme